MYCNFPSWVGDLCYQPLENFKCSNFMLCVDPCVIRPFSWVFFLSVVFSPSVSEYHADRMKPGCHLFNIQEIIKWEKIQDGSHKLIWPHLNIWIRYNHVNYYKC